MKAKDRLQIYERFFHQINLNLTAGRNSKVADAVNLIDAWSYAHRCGNGENSDMEQQRIVDKIIVKMKDYV